MTLSEGLKAFYPRAMPVKHTERLRSALGGAIGIAFTAFISLWLAQHLGLTPWLVAPLGASAVLVFAVPSSPLAQPWSVVGGNTVSALAGLLTYNLVPDPVMAASLAVGLAIGAMFALRCLHPPGGAMALLVVLTGTHDFMFALFPALTNSVLLVVMGVIYNYLTQKAYPHVALSAPARPSGLLRIREDDLAAALREHNEVLDIAPDDLVRLLEMSELRAWQRMAGQKTCGHIMSAPVISVHFGTYLKDVWRLMNTHDIQALPVVDRKHRVHGLVTRQHVLQSAALVAPDNPEDGLKRLITPSGETHSEIPEVAGQIMQENYEITRADTPLEAIMPLFQRDDSHYVLVVDSERRLKGIISRSDMMQALHGGV
ncbi:MAG: HPP family protein [Asticcacaulis sp.]